MLQEATRAINSAFNNSFIKKLSQYLHDCVREEVKSSTFRNLKADKDNKWIFLNEEDTLFEVFQDNCKSCVRSQIFCFSENNNARCSRLKILCQHLTLCKAKCP